MALGVAQRPQQYPHVLQIELLRWRLCQFVSEREHAGDCGLVGHNEALSREPSA